MSETNDDISTELLQLRALCVLHAAEISALYHLLEQLHGSVAFRDSSLDAFADAFLQLRKEAGQQLLLQIENRDPKLAARIQSMLDKSCTNFPI